ncbi:MAG: hypothetical protein U0075_11535 [Thermomicrobiales bacterium]
MTTRITDSTDDVETEGRDPQPQAATQIRNGRVRPIAAVVAALAFVVAAGLSISALRVPLEAADANLPRKVAAIIISSVIFLLAVSVVAFRPETGHLKALVKTSAAWTIALLLGLTATWWIIVISDPLSGWHGQLVLDDGDVQTYLSSSVPDDTNLIVIPTGIFLQSLEFLTGDNIQISGFYWQRFGPDVPDDFVRGLVFPEAIRDAYKQTEAYRYTEGDVETIGWYFETTIREPFDYTYFPFDRQDAWLRLWSRDFTHDVSLVPDFASYNTMDPRMLPGLERDFVYSGWNPRFSGFSMAIQEYTTSFGIGSGEDVNLLPELYFNLILDRKFVGAFFEHFIFALAVAIVLYGLLVLTTDDENLKTRFQLTTAGVLAACSGLIFAVILKHNQLRSLLGTRGVSYIEIIPILLYLAIAAVIINAIVLASPLKLRLIHHRNNLWPVLLYWPVLLGTLLLATLYLFYIA